MTHPSATGVPTVEARARMEMQVRAKASGNTGPWTDSIVNPSAPMSQLIRDATQFAKDGDLALAHLHWQAACALVPENTTAALGFAQSLHRVEGPFAARNALIALVERYPTFVPARIGLARQLSGMKEYLAALRETETVLRLGPDHPVALIIRADCLHQFRRDQEAQDCLTRAVRNNPELPSPRLKLAGLYFAKGRFDRVLALCDGADRTDPRLTDLFLLGARAAFRSGHHANAAALFRGLLDGGPNDLKIRRAQVHEHLGALDFVGAYEQIAELLEQFPNDLAGYAMVVPCLSSLGQGQLLWQVLGRAPAALYQSRPFQLTVLLPANQSQFRVEDCKAIIAAHSVDGLSVDQSLPLITALWVHGDRQLATTFLADLLDRHPDDFGVMRKCITIFGSHSQQELRRIKAGFLERLSPLESCQLLSGLAPNVLTPQERQTVVQWTLKAEVLQTAAQHRNFLLGFLHENDAEVIETLLAGYREPVPFFRMMAPVLTARCADQTAQPVDVLGRKTGDDSHRHSRVCLSAADLACKDPEAPAQLYSIAALLTGLLATRQGPSWMDSGENRVAALGLCDWLAGRIRNGTPTSVIRLGDGEGRFLPYPAALLDAQAEDQAQVQRDPWWGSVLLNSEHVQNVSKALVQAVANADLLGIPPMSRLLAEFSWTTAICHRDCRGLNAIFDHLRTPGFGGLFGSCNLHADLDRWDLYGRVLADCKTVTLLSCHDLSAFLGQKFNVATRVFYKIPGEYRYRVGTTAGQPQQSESRIYPDVFESIMSRLDPDPGEVHLVGAGFLGKLFCDRIRAKGGIAIDIGSQADRWANQTTRAYFKSG